MVSFTITFSHINYQLSYNDLLIFVFAHLLIFLFSYLPEQRVLESTAFAK